MTVQDCEILLNALDYTMGILHRDGSATARLREGLVMARKDAISKESEVATLKCSLCNKPNATYIHRCGAFHPGCLDVHAVTCERCKAK